MTATRETGFDVVVRVARLALQSSGEGVEYLERCVARAATAYDVDVDLVLLPEQVVLTDCTTGEVDRVVVLRAAPGIFRLDQVAALKRVVERLDEPVDPGAACRMLDAVESMPPRSRRRSVPASRSPRRWPTGRGAPPG